MRNTMNHDARAYVLARRDYRLRNRATDIAEMVLLTILVAVIGYGVGWMLALGGL